VSSGECGLNINIRTASQLMIVGNGRAPAVNCSECSMKYCCGTSIAGMQRKSRSSTERFYLWIFRVGKNVRAPPSEKLTADAHTEHLVY